MAQPRSPGQCDACLTGAAQHRVFGAVGQRSSRCRPADRPLMPTSNPRSAAPNVAAPAVAVAHPANVLVVLAAADEVGHRQLVDGVDVELLAAGGGDDVFEEIVGQRHPAQSQDRREGLAGRPEVGDAMRIETLDRTDGLPVVAELTVVVVFDDVTAGAPRPSINAVRRDGSSGTPWGYDERR